jgi:hypothetical protein
VIFEDYPAGPRAITLGTKRPIGRAVALWHLPTHTEIKRIELHCEGRNAMRFSPNGMLLSFSESGKDLSFRDISAILRSSARSDMNSIGLLQMENAWKSLASDDVACAYEALWSLIRLDDKVSVFIDNNLAAVVETEKEIVDELAKDLDDDRFTVRSGAARKLSQLGERAAPRLKDLLRTKVSLEARERIKSLLETVDCEPLGPEGLRSSRAVMALEWLGTPNARRVLAKLAKGMPSARQTKDAQAALDRQQRLMTPNEDKRMRNND